LSLNPVVQSDVLSNSSFADFLNDLMPWVRKLVLLLLQVSLEWHLLFCLLWLT